MVQLTVAGHSPLMRDGGRPADFHRWLNDDGSVYLSFHRIADGYLLRFPELADFVVSHDGGQVTVHPAQGLDQGTVDHLWLNQVLPLALSRQGRMVLHGSAVDVDGQGVAFLADSGMGKSTLAASFATSGTRFLTDDGLLLERAGQDWLIQPSHPSIRLWHDSEGALAPPGAKRAPAVSYTDKTRLLAGDGLAFCKEARPLRCVFFLGDEEVTQARIEAVRGTDALMGYVQNSFLLDVQARDLLARQFDELAEMTARPMHYRLDYPREYEALPAVRQAIIDHVRAAAIAI
jgi:hypothetical protein